MPKSRPWLAAGDAGRGGLCHPGALQPPGQNGPCADALIWPGVARWWLRWQDPNPAVAAGDWKRACAQPVLQVDCGLLASEARLLIPGFIARMTRGRGRVRVKLAMSWTAYRHGVGPEPVDHRPRRP